MLGPLPISACLGQYLNFNIFQSSRHQMFISLKFIEDFIILVKNIFLTKSQNLATERNFIFWPNFKNSDDKKLFGLNRRVNFLL